MKIVYLCISVALTGLIACGGPQSSVTSNDLVGSDETVAFEGIEGTRDVPASTLLEAREAVNLRQSPSIDAPISMVVPEGATMSLLQSAPENGFYKVNYQGREGWSYGAYLGVVVLKTASSGLTEAERDNIMERGSLVVGYSYWWGHGRFGCGLGHGSCSGSCPSCSHSGSAGADCSGFVAKAWDVPWGASGTCTDGHPYSTYTFYDYRYYWSKISRDNATRADAFVHPGHMFLRRGGGDNWGNIQVYECSGCSTGCVTHYRTAASDYIVIRRDTRP